MLHFFVVSETMRQLLLYQIDNLEFIRFIMKVGVNKVDVILSIEYVIDNPIRKVFFETRQILGLLIYLDGLNKHLMVASCV